MLRVDSRELRNDSHDLRVDSHVPMSTSKHIYILGESLDDVDNIVDDMYSNPYAFVDASDTE